MHDKRRPYEALVDVGRKDEAVDIFRFMKGKRYDRGKSNPEGWRDKCESDGAMLCRGDEC